MNKDNIKKKLIIGVDLDDVVFNFNDSFHMYHNARYGTDTKRENITDFGVEKILKCTPEEAAIKVFEFYFAPEHIVSLPVEGAAQALSVLSKEHELHIITARGDQVRDVTLNWIEQNFSGHFKSVNLTNQYFGLSEKKCTKIDICKELGVQVMIDDSPSNAHEISAAGLPVILLDTPWNQGKMPPNVTRVKTWSEIMQAIDVESKKKLSHED